MVKVTQIACLAGAALFVLAVSVAGQRPSAPPNGPSLLALQQPETKSFAPQGPRSSSLSKMGWIGLMLEEGNGQEVRVKGVFPGGPAAFAGVHAGDVLTRIDGTNIDSLATATAAIEGLVPQREAKLSIRRQGKPFELHATVGSLGEFRENYVQEMLRRDPRDAHYGQHHGVSDADMSVEVIRRLFEQHERLERTLQQVLDEVHALRKEVREVRSLQK